MNSNNIFLIGLMGSGKTTIGRLLSKKLDKFFFDSDQVIEERLGVKVPLIFEYEGESGFRDRESNVLKDLVAKKNIILATGGGVILSSKNRELLSSNGVVIYLKADYENLAKRMENDKSRPLLQGKEIIPTLKNKSRPLLQGKEIIPTLKKLFKTRDPLYTSIADYKVNTKNKKAYQIEKEIRLLITKSEND